MRGGRRRWEAAAEQRVVYVDQGPSTRYDERYADEDFVGRPGQAGPPRRWDLPRATWRRRRSSRRRSATTARLYRGKYRPPRSSARGRRSAPADAYARARGRPAEEPPAPPPKALPPTPPTAQTPPHSSSSDDEPALNESNVYEATAGAIREVADLRAAAIDGSLTLKMTRTAVVDRLALGAGGDRLPEEDLQGVHEGGDARGRGGVAAGPVATRERRDVAAGGDLECVRRGRPRAPRWTWRSWTKFAKSDPSNPPSRWTWPPTTSRRRRGTPSVTSASRARTGGAVLAGVGGLNVSCAGRSRRPGTRSRRTRPWRRGRRCRSSSSSSDDDMPSLSSSVASPAPAAASPAGAPTSEQTQCRTTPDLSGAPAVRPRSTQFDARPRPAGAGTLAGVRDDAVVDAVLCHAGRGVAGPRDADAARGHRVARTRDADRNATTRGSDVRHADAAASRLRRLAGERHAERRGGVGAAAGG